jgi:hypothetical protein
MWPAAPGAHRHRQVDPAAFLHALPDPPSTYILAASSTPSVLKKNTILEQYHGLVYQL